MKKRLQGRGAGAESSFLQPARRWLPAGRRGTSYVEISGERSVPKMSEASELGHGWLHRVEKIVYLALGDLALECGVHGCSVSRRVRVSTETESATRVTVDI